MTSDATIDGSSTEGTWQRITGLVDELAELSRQDMTPSQFHGELLDRLVCVSGAVAGAVWLGGKASPPILAHHVNLPCAHSPVDGGTLAWQRALAARVLADGQPLAVGPRRGSSQGEADHAEQLVLMHAIRLDDEPIGVVQLVLDAGRQPAVSLGGRQLLAAVCDIAADFHAHCRLRQLRDFERLQGCRDEFVRRVLHDLDLDAVSFAIANEGRRVIECDRVSVVLCQRRGCRVACISGVDTLDRRSPAAGALEQLAATAAAEARAWWYNSTEPPDELPAAVREHLGDSRTTRLGVLPLCPSAGAGSTASHPIAVLVVEEFRGPDGLEPWDEFQRRSIWVAEHGVAALGIAQRMAEMPRLGIGRGLSGAGNRSLRRWLGAAIALGVGTAMLFIPVEFRIGARGELQPVEQQIVYAPRDAIVKQLPAIHRKGSSNELDVQRGEVLVELQSDDLDEEITTLLGERSTRQQQLEAVTITLDQLARSAGPGEVDKATELSASKLELTALLDSLEQRLAVLRREKERLTIAAAIDGRVQTWDVAAQLQARPVRQGQRLMTVVHVAGPWQLRLEVADEDIGHVNAARAAAGQPLPISFLERSAPERVLRARLQQVAMSTEIDPIHGPSVRAIASIDDPRPLAGMRPGSRVLARIHCGRRPLGYVWLHQLIEFIRTRVLF
jgi:hypothetical protein